MLLLRVFRVFRLDYAFETEWFDRQLGEMITRLESIGELDNTSIVVTSDNGMPFPQVKGQMYDDDFHLPLAVRWGARDAGAGGPGLHQLDRLRADFRRGCRVGYTPSALGEEFRGHSGERSGWLE
ncbi:MAG: hypothetical protein CME19_23070 [Gemmatimonadetes bacterium]|nr:hypothetical protein [Gemmatimonadota bacterium]